MSAKEEVQMSHAKIQKISEPSDIAVKVKCPFCERQTRVALYDIRPNDSYECKKCHNAVYMSVDQVTDLRDRIGRMLERWL
jgi:hypothetical protein